MSAKRLGWNQKWSPGSFSHRSVVTYSFSGPRRYSKPGEVLFGSEWPGSVTTMAKLGSESYWLGSMSG
jgi:hypothetical protein